MIVPYLVLYQNWSPQASSKLSEELRNQQEKKLGGSCGACGLRLSALELDCQVESWLCHLGLMLAVRMNSELVVSLGFDVGSQNEQ